MFKYMVALLVVAVSANAYYWNSPDNSATNANSPYAQIHQHHLQNTYDYTGGYYGGYGPYGPYGGFGGINNPINRADNQMSLGAVITNTNSQNTYRF